MQSQRIHELDWLRVFAFMALMLYHTGMFFVGWDFHFSNKQTLTALEDPMIFISQWRLGLLFAISGAGTWFALRRRSGNLFIGERTKRLLLPLAFGMFFIIPPQIYTEWRIKGVIEPGYWQFWASVFQFTPYPEGSFSWHHLWFVAYLYVFSLFSLPLFLYLKGARGQAHLEALRTWLAGGALRTFAPALLLILANQALRRSWPTTHNLSADWANLVDSFLLFWFGFLVISSDQIRASLEKNRQKMLFATAVVFTIERILVNTMNMDTDLFYYLYWALRPAYCWLIILTILGYARRYLNHSHAFLRYANQAVYPYYILHQSVMLVLGYFIIPLDWNAWIKFLAILVGMFAVSGLLYEFLIRKVSWLRPLFGLKSLRPHQPRTVPSEDPGFVATSERATS